MAHMTPLQSESVPEDIQERFIHYKNTRGFTPNSIQTMARRPDVVRAFMQLNQAVLYQGTVSEELKMLVSLVASQTAGCRYCQAHMANLSKIYSASAEKIGHVWEFETSDLFTDAERTALRLAYHGSMSPSTASKEDFDEARKYFSDSEVVEIVASIALFGFLNRWNDTMATDIEDLPCAGSQRNFRRIFWLGVWKTRWLAKTIATGQKIMTDQTILEKFDRAVPQQPALPRMINSATHQFRRAIVNGIRKLPGMKRFADYPRLEPLHSGSVSLNKFFFAPAGNG